MSTDEKHAAHGEISRIHGDTMISTLRSIYGPSFASSCQPTAMLSDVLAELDTESLAELDRDQRSGALERKLAAQA